PEASQTIAKLTERIAGLQPAADAQARADKPADASKAAEGPVLKNDGAVTIEKRAPQAKPRQTAARAAEKKQAAFVPQPPALAKKSPRRMPKVEDFPPHAQMAMKAQEGDEPKAGIEAQKKKAGFFERLTGRRNAKVSEPEIVRDKEPGLKAPDDNAASAAGEPAGRHKAAVQAPAKSRLSRAAGTPKPSDAQVAIQDENEDLDIPAFLKRQAN
ncbi:MAG: hypothetical protein ACE5FM_07235, partial [Methyloligellaceae bacterium]